MASLDLAVYLLPAFKLRKIFSFHFNSFWISLKTTLKRIIASTQGTPKGVYLIIILGKLCGHYRRLGVEIVKQSGRRQNIKRGISSQRKFSV